MRHAFAALPRLARFAIGFLAVGAGMMLFGAAVLGGSWQQHVMAAVGAGLAVGWASARKPQLHE